MLPIAFGLRIGCSLHGTIKAKFITAGYGYVGFGNHVAFSDRLAGVVVGLGTVLASGCVGDVRSGTGSSTMAVGVRDNSSSK